MNSNFEWQFGGWLQRAPPAFAWSALGALALAGLALIVYLYRRTLRDLPRGKRNALTVLRVALLLVVCVVLANPSRVERPPDTGKKDERRLAVIVDRSASMYSVDNRNETRLENAVRIWKRHVPEAEKAFDRVDHYRFALSLEKAGSLEEATQSGQQGESTHLWTALHSAIADGPAAIVCLTDGLDTSGKDAGEVIGEAQARGVPLYFVPAINRSRPSESLSIQDVKTPSSVLRRSKFSASAILEISTPRDQNVPVELWSGTQKLDSTMLKARAGWNVLPWSPEVTAGEPGPMPLEFRLGEGEAQETAASTTRVVGQTSISVLYYQGALQWGYRFLLGALGSDPSFQLTSILNPALGVRLTSQGTTLDDLPDNADALKPFQIVVLAHVLADQLSTQQQQALVDYAKGGGGVLFITPDSDATTRFAGTPLEEMLPVVFQRSEETAEQKEARNFEERMRMAFDSGGEPDAVAEGQGRDASPDLVAFRIAPGGGGVLRSDATRPMFSNYARVLRAKPGAEVLAVHPTDLAPDNSPRILLARQQFGAGFTAVLTTDLLWRWKMSLPSSSHAVETFWQELMLSLAPATGEGLRIVKASSTAAVNHVTSLTVAGAPSGQPPQMEAISPAGQHQALSPMSSAGGWHAAFTPNAQGRWKLVARDEQGDYAAMSLPVEAQVRTAENSNAPPDVDGLRHIADETGGALVETSPIFQPENAPANAGPEVKSVEPLWNQSWLLGLLLGLYATELVARRMFKLL